MEIVAAVIILFFAIALQGFIYNRFVFYKLDYMCEFSAIEAHEGDEILFVETIHNKKLLPVPWLRADIHSSRWLDFAGGYSVIAQDDRRITSSFSLKSYQKTLRRWKLKCLKRGVFTTENVTLVSGDLLGNSIVSIPVRVGANLVVYPQIVNIEDLFIPANYLQGDTIVRRWIIDDPFIVSGAREYTPGDSMNRIHWSTSAKEGRLMVRKNDFTSQLSLTVFLNMQSIEYEYDAVVDRAKIEFGIKVTATVLDRALRMCIPVRMAVNGCTSDENRKMIFTGESAGKDHISGLMKILARLELKSLKDFEGYLKETAWSIENSDVIIITSYMNEGISDIVRKIKTQGNHVKVILLCDIAEAGDLPGDIDIYLLSGAGSVNE
mgnify:CR=1 FL=1